MHDGWLQRQVCLKIVLPPSVGQLSLLTHPVIRLSSRSPEDRSAREYRAKLRVKACLLYTLVGRTALGIDTREILCHIHGEQVVSHSRETVILRLELLNRAEPSWPRRRSPGLSPPRAAMARRSAAPAAAAACSWALKCRPGTFGDAGEQRKPAACGGCNMGAGLANVSLYAHRTWMLP